jgi:hypothetical protein
MQEGGCTAVPSKGESRGDFMNNPTITPEQAAGAVAAIEALLERKATLEAQYRAVVAEMATPRLDAMSWWEYNRETDRLYAESERLLGLYIECSTEIVRRTGVAA